MVKAIWNGETIAESDQTVMVEGNHYFPLDSVRPGVLVSSSRTSVCPWKGAAEYYSVRVGESENKDAAWFYAEPKPAAAEIAGRIAFWKGVEVG